MPRIEKTVFISYRRTNAAWALAVYQNLTHHGYDVFYDFTGIASGDFERVILENIRARAHFVVLLTPSALERCDEPGDWLRREIETALDSERNIVPLMLEGFDYSTPAIAAHLTGRLATLRRYNALRVPADYFEEAMGRVRLQYLNVPLEAVLHPLPGAAEQAVREQQAAADAAPVVAEKQLTAQEWFERGLQLADNRDEEIRRYTEAIRRQLVPTDRPQSIKSGVDELILGRGYTEVWVNGVKKTMTPTEARVLAYLGEHRGEACSVSMILESVYDGIGGESSVYKTIARIRYKIEPHKGRSIFLHNIKGFGYRLGGDSQAQTD